MTMVDIEPELYARIEPILKQNPINYRSVRHFVNKALALLLTKEEKKNEKEKEAIV